MHYLRCQGHCHGVLEYGHTFLHSASFPITKFHNDWSDTLGVSVISGLNLVLVAESFETAPPHTLSPPLAPLLSSFFSRSAFRQNNYLLAKA